MKENTLNKLLIAVCLLAMVSCKARKQLIVNRVADTTVTKAPVDKGLNEKAAKINAISAKQLNFITFSAKARTKINLNGSSNDVTLNIRISSGQKIWVSITAIAGIEVARALITPDSVMLINRLQSVYIRKPFSYINGFAGKQVNYKTLESLLIGNAIPELLNERGDLKMEGGNTVLSGDLQGVLFRLIVGPDMKVTQTNLDNQSAGQSLTVTNNTFIQATNRVVPSQIDIASVVKDKKIQLNLHYVKVDFDQRLDFPFSIPGRYTPAT